MARHAKMSSLTFPKRSMSNLHTHITEPYPEGKRLWLSVCEVRAVDAQRAEMKWEHGEADSLTRGEWQRVAETYTTGGAGTSFTGDPQ